MTERWTTQIVFVIPLRMFTLVFITSVSVSADLQGTTHEPRTYYLFTNNSMCLSLFCSQFAGFSATSSFSMRVCVGVCCCFFILSLISCVCVCAQQNVLFEFNTKTVLYECNADILVVRSDKDGKCMDESVCMCVWDAFHASKIFAVVVFIFIWILHSLCTFE